MSLHSRISTRSSSSSYDLGRRLRALDLSRVGSPHSRESSPDAIVYPDSASVYSTQTDSSDDDDDYIPSPSTASIHSRRDGVRAGPRRFVQVIKHSYDPHPSSAEIDIVPSHSALASPDFEELPMLSPDQAHHAIGPTGLIRSPYTAVYRKIEDALAGLENVQPGGLGSLARGSSRSFSWGRSTGRQRTPRERMFEDLTGLELTALTDPKTNPKFKPTKAEVDQLEGALRKLEAALPERRASAQLLTPPVVVSRRKSAENLWRARTAAELGAGDEGREREGRVSQRMMARYEV